MVSSAPCITSQRKRVYERHAQDLHQRSKEGLKPESLGRLTKKGKEWRDSGGAGKSTGGDWLDCGRQVWWATVERASSRLELCTLRIR